MAVRGTVERLEALRADEAAAELAPLFEGAPRYLARLAAARPFGTWDRLFERAREIAHAMPEPEQVELVDAHPRLGAAPASVSAASFREQGYDRDPDERAREQLAALNERYEAHVGFRYCVFVAGRPLASLVPELEAALRADRAAELHRALDAVVDIARARHEADASRAPGR
jgi:2-oxo-4-hydroxy-4-carboxy--5-ureidoimidazoline (OHCU) decarboxylase